MIYPTHPKKGTYDDPTRLYSILWHTLPGAAPAGPGVCPSSACWEDREGTRTRTQLPGGQGSATGIRPSLALSKSELTSSLCHARTHQTLHDCRMPRRAAGRAVRPTLYTRTSSAVPPRQRPHSFQVRSMAEVAKYLPSSEASAHMTRPSCPSMTLMSEWSRIDHSFTLLS